MKSKFIAASLLTTMGIFADNLDNNSSQNATTRNSCPSDCCKPCCAPKAKLGVDCECYVPKFYNLRCNPGVFINVEFLYFYARETHLPFALRVQGKEEVFGADTPLVLAPEAEKYFDANWKPGARVGLGWNSQCDGWDIYLNWTWIYNKEKKSTSVQEYGNGDFAFFYPLKGEFALLNPWVNASFGQTAGGVAPINAELRMFESISAHWKFWLNSIDLELGKKYWLSKYFTMRPYTGLRGSWIRTLFNTLSTRSFSNVFQNILVQVNTIFKDRFNNQFWGMGFLAGIQPTWYFTSFFALYANIDTALIWGKFKAKKREKYFDNTPGDAIREVIVSYSNLMRDNFYTMQSILDLGIGLRFEKTCCCDHYHTVLDVGWEHHIWFDTNNRLKTMDYFGQGALIFTGRKGFRTFDETPGNLMYGGLVVRLRFDF